MRRSQCPQHQFGVWLTFTHIAVPLLQERRFERPLKLLNLGHILRLEQSVGDSLQLLTEQKNGFSIGQAFRRLGSGRARWNRLVNIRHGYAPPYENVRDG